MIGSKIYFHLKLSDSKMIKAVPDDNMLNITLYHYFNQSGHSLTSRALPDVICHLDYSFVLFKIETSLLFTNLTIHQKNPCQM